MDYAVHHINNIKPGLCLYLVIEVQIEFLIMKLAYLWTGDCHDDILTVTIH